MSERTDTLAAVHSSSAGWHYFRAPEDVWVLDHVAWGDMFRREGYVVPGSEDEQQYGIPIVNETTEGAFLAALERNRQSEFALRDELRAAGPIADWFDVAHLFPVVLVDFPTRHLFSVRTDGLRFERFVPKEWVGSLESFFDRIPEAHRYWIDGEVNHLNLALGASRS